jgi:regulatory protein
MNIASLNYALKLLGKRDYSAGKLKRKMSEKDFSNDEIDQTIKILIDKKFLDDERYARNFVRNQLNIKPVGKYVLEQKLKQRFIDSEIIKKILKDINSEKEAGLAKEAANKKYQVVSIKYQGDKGKIHQILFRHLISRGFSYEIVKEVMDNYSNQPNYFNYSPPAGGQVNKPQFRN